jgi:hypothetical protein
MARALRRCVAAAAIAVIGSWTGATAVGADVVTPPGSCVGAGTWQDGGFSEASTEHVSSDVIKVPREDTVDWAGAIGNAQLGAEVPRREIAGKVEAKLPAPLGWITIDDWGGSSVRAANEGSHHYNLPSVLVGVKVKLRGEHHDAGKLTCEGSVFLQIEGGSNPLKIGAIGGMVVFGALLAYAGKPTFTKVEPAFEDVNPG